MLVHALLLIVFVVHLVVFAWLGLRRRQAYYVSLVVTFALLSGSMIIRLLAPDMQLNGELQFATALRMAAWGAAAVSVTWTLTRIHRRRLARR